MDMALPIAFTFSSLGPFIRTLLSGDQLGYGNRERLTGQKLNVILDIISSRLWSASQDGAELGTKELVTNPLCGQTLHCIITPELVPPLPMRSRNKEKLKNM